jgi:peptidoglycan/xylan/chitin deacetylase (PgdA/CDA1 family)
VQICRGEFTSVREADWNDPIVRIRLQVNPNDELTFDTLSAQVEPVPVVMIQFDDATVTDYTLAFPILQKYGIRASEFVPTGLVGTPGYMNVAQLLDLQRSGWVIGNHTVNHVLLRDLPAATQEKEISGALAALEGWGLHGGRYMAYPWGKYNSDTLAIMQRLGMLAGRTVSNAPDVFPQVNLFVLRTSQDVDGLSVADVKKKVDVALLNRHILTLVFHGLMPNGTAQGDGWNEAAFEEVIAYIANKPVTTLTIDEFVQLANAGIKVEIPGESP